MDKPNIPSASNFKMLGDVADAVLKITDGWASPVKCQCGHIIGVQWSGEAVSGVCGDCEAKAA